MGLSWRFSCWDPGSSGAHRPPAAQCRSAEGELRELDAIALLTAHPEGATPQPVRTGTEGDAGCLGDHDPVVFSGREYVTTQTPEAVLRHYRTAAAEHGWREEPAPAGDSGGPGLCLRPANGTHRVLTVDFDPTRGRPGLYRVEATSRAAGGPLPCPW